MVLSHDSLLKVLKHCDLTISGAMFSCNKPVQKASGFFPCKMQRVCF